MTDRMPKRIWAWENQNGDCWWASEDVVEVGGGAWYIRADSVPSIDVKALMREADRYAYSDTPADCAAENLEPARVVPLVELQRILREAWEGGGQAGDGVGAGATGNANP